MELRRYKNFNCAVHNKCFELNTYEEDPINKRRGRANIDGPAAAIDV